MPYRVGWINNDNFFAFSSRNDEHALDLLADVVMPSAAAPPVLRPTNE